MKPLLDRPDQGARGSTARARHTFAVAALLSVLLWFIPGADLLLYPLRIFVTLVHEAGHAFATVATGGSVVSITLLPNGNGLTLSQGGWAFVVLMAGYLFTAAAGSGCLLLARRPGGGRRALALLAVVTLAVTVLWVRPLSNPFGFGMALGFAGLLALAARYLSPRWADLALCLVAVQLGLNALSDVRYLLHLTLATGSPNDAVILSDLFGLAPWFWALVFAAGSAALVAGGVRAFWTGR